MSNQTFTALAAALIAASGGVGAAELGLAESPALAATVSPGVYLRATTASTPLSNLGAKPVTLLSVIIPAGTWLVTAKANPVNFGAADYARCLLVIGGVQQDAAATLIGDAAPAPTGEIGPSVAEIVLQAAITTTAAHSVILNCQHDFPTPGLYVDPGASIMVVKAPGPLG